MNKMRTKIYVKTDIDSREVIYSGIEFAEFIKYLPQPIENLMIVTGGSDVIRLDTKFERGLEQFEGHQLVEKLAKENVYSLGNFCFVDYDISSDTSDLSEEQIAQLLYLGHMFKPLHSPFFKQLQNRFAYLAHDDGWYCKLYCRELDEFMNVLSGKITKNINVSLPANIKNRLKQISTGGLLIDLEETNGSKKDVSLKVYTVGAYSNIDEILNNWQQIKTNAKSTDILSCSNNIWSIS